MPVVLFLGFIFGWSNYVIQREIDAINWVLLEIKTPQDIEKSPKVTEQIFAGLHGVLSPLNWRKRFFYGKTTPWFSLEVVGSGGEIHFYIRTPEEFRNVVEAQIFAQYPDAEISEVNDYVNHLPSHLPNDEYDIWGTEFKLAKEDVYPIRTHVEFEEAGGLGEAKRVDPLAAFTEVLSKLRGGENIWIQFIVQPTGSEVGDNWTKRGEKLIGELYGQEAAKEKPHLGAKIVDIMDKILPGGAPVEKKDRERPPLKFKSPTEEEAAKAINRSISKLGFRSGIRFVYVARKEVFHMSHVSGIIGSFKQFASQNLNSFRPEIKTLTAARGWFSFFFPSQIGFFAAQEKYKKKKRIYNAARKKKFANPGKWYRVANSSVLSTNGFPVKGKLLFLAAL